MSDPIHRLTLDFDSGNLAAKLICPESGCQPPGYCSECGRERGDTDKTPCDCCIADDAADFYNAKEWFSAAFDESWLLGSTTVAVEVDWDSGEGPTFTIIDASEARIRADQTERIVAWLRKQAGYFLDGSDARAERLSWAAAIAHNFGGIDKGERDDG